MSTVAPPPIAPDGPEPVVDAEALIEQARARQRRRRRAGAVVVAAMVGLGLVLVAVRAGRHGHAVIIREPGGPVVELRGFAGHGRLAFISGNAVWVLDGDRGSLRTINGPRGRYPLQPAFSPDGRWLAFLDTATQPADVAGGAPAGGQLWLARGDGTDAHPVAGLACAQLVGWSPTSDLLAVVAGPLSHRVPFGVETTVRLLTPEGAPRTLIHARYLRGALWSPDGRRIAAVTEDTARHDRLAAYPIAGGQATVWQRFDPQTHLQGMSQILVDPAGWWQGLGIGLWLYGNGMTHNNDATPLELIATPGAKPRFLAETLSDQTTRVVASSKQRLAVTPTSATASTAVDSSGTPSSFSSADSAVAARRSLPTEARSPSTRPGHPTAARWHSPPPPI